MEHDFQRIIEQKKGKIMPLYFFEYKLSPEGLGKIKDIPSLIKGYTRVIEDFGGKIVGQYRVFGENCLILIAEFPDDEAAEKWNLAPVEKQELWDPAFTSKRIFSLEEFSDIVETLP